MSGSYLTVGCQTAVAVTFATATAGKLRTRSAYREFRRVLPTVLPTLSRSTAEEMAPVVVTAEAATVVTVTVPRLAPFGFILAMLLLAGLSLVVASMLRRQLAVPCRCFGGGDRPPQMTDLVRNVILLVIAAAGGALALTGAGPAAAASTSLLAGVTGAVVALLLLNLDELWALAGPAVPDRRGTGLGEG